MYKNFDMEVVVDMLRQVAETLSRIRCSFAPILQPDDFYASDEGREKLDAICMKLLAVGELLKRIDRKTNQTLLTKYAEIDWTGVMGLRDIIAHDYFNLNPVKIYEICSSKVEPLKATVEQIITDLKPVDKKA